MFSAQCTQGKYYNNQYLSFQSFLLNIGNDFDLSSGTFTTPISGIYELSTFGARYKPRGQNFRQFWPPPPLVDKCSHFADPPLKPCRHFKNPPPFVYEKWFFPSIYKYCDCFLINNHKIEIVLSSTIMWNLFLWERILIRN